MDRLLVLGVGNLLLTDDGVGVLAAQKLMERQWPDNVSIREAGTFTQDVFYTFKGFTHLLVLDVVHAGSEPGTIYRLTEDALIQNEDQRLSLHDIDLIDSLRMAELYSKSRPELVVLGMEPHDHVNWNIGLSAPLEARFPAFMEAAEREMNLWIADHPAQGA